jgi:rfaE bifunctional protein kinase chain/domain
MVIGDLMLDQYWWGVVERISPEAPVPVVRLKETSVTLGGAANVAANIAGLLATPILIGCIGSDDDGRRFIDQMQDSLLSTDGILHLKGRPTAIKTRVIAHSQQVVRVDRESTSTIDATTESSLSQLALQAASGADIVVVSDYAKGTLTPQLVASVIETCRMLNKPVLIDPKGKDYSRYLGATILTPNRREAAEACGIDEYSDDAVFRSGTQLLTDLDLNAVVITEGEHGVTIFEKGKPPASIQAEAREIYDVTGAGDTVIAALAVALGAGLSIADGIRLANTAASLVVEQVGTTTVSFEALVTKLEQAHIKISQGDQPQAA